MSKQTIQRLHETAQRLKGYADGGAPEAESWDPDAPEQPYRGPNLGPLAREGSPDGAPKGVEASGAELKAYEPSLRERTAGAIQAGLSGLGMENYNANRLGHAFTDLAGFTPAGIPMAADDMKTAFKHNDPVGVGLAGLGILPAGGPAARAASKIGLYSHGAEAAAALPQAKGTPEQFRAMLEKAGVKPEEFKWSDWDALVSKAKGMEEPKLVVARKLPNGEVQIGKPGQIHSDLLDDAELYSGLDKAVGEMGFADKNGNFLSRSNALEFASRNEPTRAADANLKGRGLEAVNYLAPKASSGTITREEAAEAFKKGPQIGESKLHGPGSGPMTFDELSPNGQKELLDEYEVEFGKRIGSNPTPEEIAELNSYIQGVHSEYGDFGRKGAKFSEYTLPGGTNYREHLLTLPEKKYTKEQLARGEDRPSDQPFRSSHWDEPNVVAHLRMSDRFS